MDSKMSIYDGLYLEKILFDILVFYKMVIYFFSQKVRNMDEIEVNCEVILQPEDLSNMYECCQ